MSEDTFDLSTLSDAELIEQVHDDLYNGLKDEVVEAPNLFLQLRFFLQRSLKAYLCFFIL